MCIELLHLHLYQILKQSHKLTIRMKINQTIELKNLNYGTRVKRAAKSKSKSVLQFSIDGKLLNTWESARLAARTLGYNQGNISQCCVGKFKTMYGYKWKYDLLPNMEE